MRAMLTSDMSSESEEKLNTTHIKRLKDIVEDLYNTEKKVIFTMGKGGVGKTTIASSLALGLLQKGKKVHLATTDPASDLKFLIDDISNISFSSIDEKEELKKYQDEVTKQAKEGGISGDDLSYIEEDLRSPCTQEIAVFRAFAEIVESSKADVVVVDTAPTGHTLLLLDSTQSYHKEVLRTKGIMPQCVENLLPRLMNENDTEVIIVTLPEAIPVYEALRLQEDLQRAGIFAKWWVINSSLYLTKTTNRILKSKLQAETQWINKVNELSNRNLAVVSWTPKEIKGNALKELLN